MRLSYPPRRDVYMNAGASAVCAGCDGMPGNGCMAGGLIGERRSKTDGEGMTDRGETKWV